LEGEFVKGVLVEGAKIKSGDVLCGKFRNGSLHEKVPLNAKQNEIYIKAVL